MCVIHSWLKLRLKIGLFKVMTCTWNMIMRLQITTTNIMSACKCIIFQRILRQIKRQFHWAIPNEAGSWFTRHFWQKITCNCFSWKRNIILDTWIDYTDKYFWRKFFFLQILTRTLNFKILSHQTDQNQLWTFDKCLRRSSFS